MTKKSAANCDEARPTGTDLRSEDRLQLTKTRNKARRLTEYCVKCEDIGTCQLGKSLASTHKEFCGNEVGNDFKYCAKCSHTLNGNCPIDKANIALELQEQLAVCTRKRGLGLPLCLLRLDVLFPENKV